MTGTAAREPILELLLGILDTELAWPLPEVADLGALALGEQGLGLDSLSIIDLSLCIEERFDIAFSDEDVLLIAAGTLAGLAAVVRERVDRDRAVAAE